MKLSKEKKNLGKMIFSYLIYTLRTYGQSIVFKRLFFRTDRAAYLLKIIPRVRGFEWREEGGGRGNEQKEKSDSVLAQSSQNCDYRRRTACAYFDGLKHFRVISSHPGHPVVMIATAGPRFEPEGNSHARWRKGGNFTDEYLKGHSNSKLLLACNRANK